MIESSHHALTFESGLLASRMAQGGSRAGSNDDPIFPTLRGGRLSRDALEHLVHKYADSASKACPTLREKRVTPHVLRVRSAKYRSVSGMIVIGRVISRRWGVACRFDRRVWSAVADCIEY